MLKRILAATICIVFSFSISSCSVFRSNHQIISVSASEPDAQTWVNNSYAGKTPVQVSVMRNKSVGIMVKKDGFEPSIRTIDPHLNATGILDIVGTFIFLLPAIGLMTPGAWSIDETDIYFNLLKKEG